MKNFILAFFLLVTSCVFAQKPNNPVSAGFLVGMNFSRMNFNKSSPVPPPPSPVTTYFEPTLRVGLYTSLQFSKRISLRNEYIFSQVKNMVHTSNRKFTLNYVELPVLVNYNVYRKFSLQAGPTLGFLINASSQTNNVTKDITHDTEERSIGLTFGTAVALSSRVAFSARYQHGFNHIGIGQRSDVSEFKLEQVQLLLQVRF